MKFRTPKLGKLMQTLGLLAFSFLLASTALAQATTGNTPFANPPKLQVPIPGVTLTQPLINAGHLSAPYLAQYISGIYKFLLSIVGVVAGVSMIYGGFLWMTSGGAADRAKAGKKRISDAVIGMILAYGSYLILYLINPATVNFKNFDIIAATPETYSAEDQNDEGDNTEVPPTTPSAPIDPNLPRGPICRTVDTCNVYCKQDKGTWPKSVQGALSPTDAVVIPDSAGLSNPNHQTAGPALSSALVQAGKAAVAMDRGYVLVVTSGYRPLAKQIELVCAKIRAADAASSDAEKSKILNLIGTAVAWPGGSNHGYGNAVDLKLTKDGNDLTVSGNYSAQQDIKYRAPSQILDQIMTKANFKRYAKEIWHFEVNTNNACRCTAGNCPWPPSC